MINYYPRPSDCVKGSPFEKLLWYAWYVLAEQLSPEVRDEAKDNLIILIRCAAELKIDQMAIAEMRLTTFRLLR